MFEVLCELLLKKNKETQKEPNSEMSIKFIFYFEMVDKNEDAIVVSLNYYHTFVMFYLSVVIHSLSFVICHLSTVNCQLSTFHILYNFPLNIYSLQLSVNLHNISNRILA